MLALRPGQPSWWGGRRSASLLIRTNTRCLFYAFCRITLSLRRYAWNPLQFGSDLGLGALQLCVPLFHRTCCSTCANRVQVHAERLPLQGMRDGVSPETQRKMEEFLEQGQKK